MWKDTDIEYFRVLGMVIRFDFMLSVIGFRYRIRFRKVGFFDVILK